MSGAPTTGRIAFLDAPSGIAGDMLLGALVDAGLDLRVLEALPHALGLQGVEIQARRVTRGVLAATKVDVRVDDQAGLASLARSLHRSTPSAAAGSGAA